MFEVRSAESAEPRAKSNVSRVSGLVSRVTSSFICCLYICFVVSLQSPHRSFVPSCCRVVVVSFRVPGLGLFIAKVSVCSFISLRPFVAPSLQSFFRVVVSSCARGVDVSGFRLIDREIENKVNTH
jgi:hypothetical protein